MTKLSFTSNTVNPVRRLSAVATPAVYPAAHVNRAWRSSGLCLVLLLLGGCASPLGKGAFKSDSSSLKPPAKDVSARKCRETGIQLAADQRDDEAITQFEKAKKLSPELKGVAHPLAVLHDRRGNWQAAAGEYQRALRESPNDADLLNDYGYYLYSRNDLRRSRDMLNRALNANPQHPKARLNLAMVYAAAGEMEQAFAAFERSVGTAAAHHNVGMLLARSGRRDEALAHLRHAVELDPALSRSAQVIAKLESDSAAPSGAIRHVSGNASQTSDFRLGD